MLWTGASDQSPKFRAYKRGGAKHSPENPILVLETLSHANMKHAVSSCRKESRLEENSGRFSGVFLCVHLSSLLAGDILMVVFGLERVFKNFELQHTQCSTLYSSEELYVPLCCPFFSWDYLDFCIIIHDV